MPDSPKPYEAFDAPAVDEAELDHIVDCLAATGAYDDDVVLAEIVDDLRDPELVFDSGAIVLAEDAEVGFTDDIPLDAITTIRRGLLQMDDARQELARQGDKDGLANGVADIALLVSDLSTIGRDARLDLARIMLAGHVDGDGEPLRGNPKHEVEGLGVVDVPGGSEWKGWESERLLRDLMVDAILDTDGMLLPFDHPSDVVTTIFDVLVACLPVTASLQWRVGTRDKATGIWSGLRGAGIDPEDYAERVEKDRLAKVPSRKLEDPAS